MASKSSCDFCLDQDALGLLYFRLRLPNFPSTLYKSRSVIAVYFWQESPLVARVESSVYASIKRTVIGCGHVETRSKKDDTNVLVVFIHVNFFSFTCRP